MERQQSSIRSLESDISVQQDNFIRFQYELEFVQMLSNPDYLNCSIFPLLTYSFNNKRVFRRPSFYKFP